MAEITFKDAMLELFREAYAGPSHDYTWFIGKDGLFSSLEPLSAEMASRTLRPGGTTIAAHAEHLRWSLALANAYFRGEKPQEKWSESWSVRTVSDSAWNELRAALHREYETLLAAMEKQQNWSDSNLLLDTLSLVPHAAYHLGAIRQLVLLLPASEQRVVPALRITDYVRSKAFYSEGLGFTVDWEHRFEPHFPVFMQISREGLVIYLTQHTGDCQVGGLVHFFVPSVDDWYAELQRKGVAVKDPPNDRPEGLRDMTVVDPDGNQLRFLTRKEKLTPS